MMLYDDKPIKFWSPLDQIFYFDVSWLKHWSSKEEFCICLLHKLYVYIENGEDDTDGAVGYEKKSVSFGTLLIARGCCSLCNSFWLWHWVPQCYLHRINLTVGCGTRTWLTLWQILADVNHANKFNLCQCNAWHVFGTSCVCKKSVTTLAAYPKCLIRVQFITT